MRLRTVVIIGSTGSIGTQTIQALERINAFETRYEIIGIAAKSSGAFLEQVRTIRPKAYAFEREVPSTPAKYFNDSRQLIEYLQPDICVIASGGSQTLEFTVSAVKNASRVCLANKESMVMAGGMIKSLAQAYKTEIIPVDSEHSSVFQLINGERLEAIENVFITASGGALRDWPTEKLKNATVEDVLKHPNWKMGEKITVDSATLFNKGLEVIEAAEFFGLDKECIKTVFSYSSYIHAIAVFKDGSIKLHAGEPNMQIPIAYALTHPERLLRSDPVVFDTRRLELNVLEIEHYPALMMAYEVLNQGNSKRIAYNASNETAVQLFLEERISFTDIFKIVREAIDQTENEEINEIDDIIEYNQIVKTKTKEKWRGLR